MTFKTGLTFRETALRTMKAAIHIVDIEEFEEQLVMFNERGLKLQEDEIALLKGEIEKGHPMEREWFEETLEEYI